MAQLAYMPWCKLNKTCQVGNITLIPFIRAESIPGVDESAQASIRRIFSTHKNIDGTPIEHGTMIKYGQKLLTEDLTVEEQNILYDQIALACFSGLAKNEFFNQLGARCNSTCFVVHIQKFNDANFTSITTRLREGTTSSLWAMDEVKITVPMHCHTIQNVVLDEPLLSGLSSYYKQSRSNEWAKWQNAISCFNQANTDSENVNYQVEWVLLASAFEHILDARSNDRDVASKFCEIFVPKTVLIASKSTRNCERWHDQTKPLRYEWMREFYHIRGDFAHGKLTTRQPMNWNPMEHLVLGSISFPLVVKRLLQKADQYTLTVNDLAQMNMLESFADIKNCLKPPADQNNSIDSHWSRLCNKEQTKLTIEDLLKTRKTGGVPAGVTCDPNRSLRGQEFERRG